MPEEPIELHIQRSEYRDGRGTWYANVTCGDRVSSDADGETVEIALYNLAVELAERAFDAEDTIKELNS